MPQELSVLLAKRKTIAPNRQPAKPKPEKIGDAGQWRPSVLRLWDALAQTIPGSEAAAQILEAYRT